MSYEIDLGSKKLVAKTTSGKIYLWVENYTGDEKREIGTANGQKSSESPSAVVRACLLAAGATQNTVELSYDQFSELVEYVMTNEDLRQDDPRSGLLTKLRNSRVVDGWNKRWNEQSKRLEL